MAVQNDNDLFSKLGVDVGDGKLNIDLNQTRAFFDALKMTFENTAQNLQKDLADGKVDMAENVGIKIDKENINIDLEKTKSFIESFGQKIEGFIAEIEKSVQDISVKDINKK
jgi:uncharacterized protein YpuA (DUF1002 family)